MGRRRLIKEKQTRGNQTELREQVHPAARVKGSQEGSQGSGLDAQIRAAERVPEQAGEGGECMPSCSQSPL